jgi:pimeloyl-ACP methyl ester carboxylesterase
MSFDVVKRGAGPTLLLIHGTGATSDFWGEGADRLADRCHVITYDRRGTGQSSNRPTAHHDEHAEDAAGCT